MYIYTYSCRLPKLSSLYWYDILELVVPFMISLINHCPQQENHICGALWFACSRRVFVSRAGQTKDCKIGICCFSTKHAAFTRKSKDCLAWNQDNMSEWSNKSTLGRLLFQWTSSINIQLSVLDLYKADIIIIPSIQINLSRHDIDEILSLGVKQQSLIHSYIVIRKLYWT